MMSVCLSPVFTETSNDNPMKPKSWNINRLRLSEAVALPLPCPSSKACPGKDGGKVLPKRMVVSYIAYGCTNLRRKTALITIGTKAVQRRRSSFQPVVRSLAPLKDSVSYLKGLEHAGGVGMGATAVETLPGADMTASEKTNNVSVDQVARS